MSLSKDRLFERIFPLLFVGMGLDGWFEMVSNLNAS